MFVGLNSCVLRKHHYISVVVSLVMRSVVVGHGNVNNEGNLSDRNNTKRSEIDILGQRLTNTNLTLFPG